MITSEIFKQHLFQLTERRRFVVAYSGGVDSRVLLELMATIDDIELTAVHVNHHLHPDADAWQQQCGEVCQQLDIPLKTLQINVIKKPRHSLEALAREQRYQALEYIIDEKTALLTGHNENDQAETVLLQLMRGAGVKGLSAMPSVKPFGKGQLVRPLLAATRQDIDVYAQQKKLTWVEDSSNQENEFDRNFLRNQIIPELQQRRQGVIQNIVRSANHVADAAKLIEEFAASDYEVVRGQQASTLNLEALKNLTSARQSNVIRFWLGQQHKKVRLPSQAILQQIKQQLIYSAPDAHPLVSWGHVMLRRQKKELTLTFLQ